MGPLSLKNKGQGDDHSMLFYFRQYEVTSILDNSTLITVS